MRASRNTRDHFLSFYRPHPKDGEGNVFSLSTPGGGGVSGHSPAGGGGQVRLQPGGGGGSGHSPARGGQVRVQPGGGQSSRGGGGGQSSQQGGSASCALLRAVCLLRSRRRTFLFYNINTITTKRYIFPAVFSQECTFSTCIQSKTVFLFCTHDLFSVKIAASSQQ